VNSNNFNTNNFYTNNFNTNNFNTINNINTSDNKDTEQQQQENKQNTEQQQENKQNEVMPQLQTPQTLSAESIFGGKQEAELLRYVLTLLVNLSAIGILFYYYFIILFYFLCIYHYITCNNQKNKVEV
jgi:preprotein translocase subunit SecF